MGPSVGSVVSDIARVEAELAALWRESAVGGEPVLRACSMNLVVVCDTGPEELAETTRQVASVVETMPGRALVVVPRPAGEQRGLTAYVTAHCHRGAEGKQVCSEHVTLEADPASMSMIPGTVLQLLVEATPVYTWWRRPSLAGDALFGALRDLSDRVFVNAARFADPATGLDELQQAVTPTWRGHLEDLTWAGIEPWREAVASFFDAPRTRSLVERVSALRIVAGGPATGAGAPVAGAYLAGWLASRLGWRPPASARGPWSRRDDERVALEFIRDPDLSAGEIGSVRLEAEDRGTRVAFVAERPETGSPFVKLRVEAREDPPPLHMIRLPDRGPDALLCGMLQRSGADPLLAAALSAAARLV